MIKILRPFLMLLCSFKLSAQQDASVDRSIYGVQVGVLGLYGYNEFRLADQFALRPEIGLSGGIGSGFYDKDVFFFLIPEIAVAGRWYYNLGRRLKKGRNISKNSGNFVAIKLGYLPDWFSISNGYTINLDNSIYSSLKWGIRRTIIKHLTYETAIGLGLGVHYDRYMGESYSANYGFVDLHLRIGYTF